MMMHTNQRLKVSITLIAMFMVVYLIFMINIPLGSSAFGDMVQEFSLNAVNDLPQGITIDGNFIYVLDKTDKKIYKYNLTGTYIGALGDALAYTPTGLAHYGEYFYIGEASTSNIHKHFMSNLTDVSNFAITGTISDVGTNGTFIIAFTEGGAGSAIVYDMAGNSVKTIASSVTGLTASGLRGGTFDGIYVWVDSYSDQKMSVIWYGNGSAVGLNITNYGATPDYAQYLGTYKGYTYGTEYGSDKVYKYEGLSVPDYSLPPVMTQISPANNYGSLPNTITFNCSASRDGASSLKNISLLTNESGTWDLVNTTAVTGIYNWTTFTRTYSDLGAVNWACYGCSDFDVCGASATNRSFSIKPYVINSVTYTTPTYINLNQQFTMNLSSSAVPSNAYLNYSGTLYSASIDDLGNNNYNISKVLLISSTGSNNFTLQWFNGTANLSSSVYTQVVSDLTLDNCSVLNQTLYNFTLYDEKTLALLSNSTLELLLNVLDSSSNSVVSWNVTYNASNNYAVCLNTNLSVYHYFLDVLVRYSAINYSIEYYNVQKLSTYGNTFPKNISLYDLDNTSATIFKIIYKDSSLLARQGYAIQILRRYIGQNVYRVSELPLTDSNGEAIASFEKNNVIYSFVTTKNGAVVDTFSDYFVRCSNELLGTCEIYLTSPYASSTLTDYTTIGDFSFKPYYNSTSRNVTLTFSIPSGTNALILLNVTTTDALETQVCTDSITGITGTLTCNIPLSYGNQTARVYVYKDGNLMGYSIIDTSPTPSQLLGGSLVFLFLCFIITLIGLGLSDSPVKMAVFLIIGGVGGVLLGFVVNNGVIGKTATILWLIIAIILVIYKGSNRE